MRLICPNCDAQYEVAEGAIPEVGRDVQCSNCGHAWFQFPPESELAAETDDALFDAPEAPAVEPPPMPEPEPEPEPQVVVAVPEPVAQRRVLDDALMAVLREEAERETAARRAEPARAVETQAELGLVAPAAPVRQAVKPKVAEPEVAVPEVTKTPARRDLLPNIEEINSTLRASSDRRGADGGMPEAPVVVAERAGFRSGFVLVMGVAVVLAALYIGAPKLAAQFPAAAPALSQYVVVVDAGRGWLDGAMKDAVGMLQNLANNAN